MITVSKSLVCDVFDAVLIDNTDKSVVGTTTLQSANIDVAVSEVEVRAGKGNVLQATLHIQRDINIELTDIEWSPEWIAKQLGTSIKLSDDAVAYAMPKWYEAVDLDEEEPGTAIGFKLDNTPLTTGSGLAIFDEDGEELTLTTDYTISGDTVTISSATAGDKFEVRTYKYTAPEDTQVLNIESDKFAKGVTLILSTFETDENEAHQYEIQYQFPNAIPNGSFQINTTSERNAATQSVTFKVAKPTTSTVVGTYLRIKLDDGTGSSGSTT